MLCRCLGNAFILVEGDAEMLPHRVNALCDLRIVDQHPREYHVLCNHLVKFAVIQTHIALDDGIHDRRIEHPRRKTVCIMEETAYDKEI